MNHCQQRISLLQEAIPQLSVQEAYKQQQEGALILDVRTEAEYQHQHISQAQYLGRDYLEMRIEAMIPDYQQPIILACGGGTRSLFAAESLRQLGYENVYNMAGGFRDWVGSELPTS